MSFFEFNNPDFKHFVLKQITGKNDQKLRSKIRELNKEHNLQFEEVVNWANIDHKNLKKLATSKFAPQIQNLKLRVPVELESVNDLRYISAEYFVNIVSVEMRFVGSPSLGSDEHPICQLRLTQNCTIRGLTVKKNAHVKQIGIHSTNNVNISISNSKFHGLQIYAHTFSIFRTLQIIGVKFSGTYGSGNDIRNYSSVNLRDIHVKNCAICGLYISNCQKVVLQNITIKKCQNKGCIFIEVPNFLISNVKIFECQAGIALKQTNGRFTNLVVRGCGAFGVSLRNSQVRYHGFLCTNIGGDDIVIWDNLELDQSVFIQGV